MMPRTDQSSQNPPKEQPLSDLARLRQYFKTASSSASYPELTWEGIILPNQRGPYGPRSGH